MNTLHIFDFIVLPAALVAGIVFGIRELRNRARELKIRRMRERLVN